MIIPATTKVLERAEAASLLVVDTARLSFPGSSPYANALGIGDVIVADTSATLPWGLLRTVERKETVGGRVVVTTRQADLGEAITRGSVRFTTPLEVPSSPSGLRPPRGDDPGAKAPSAMGPTVSPSGVTGAAPFAYSLPATTFGGTVTASGSTTVSPGLEFDVEIERAMVKRLSFVLTYEIQQSLEIGAEADASVTWSQTLLTRPLRPLVAYIGIVPIVLAPELSLRFTGTGSLTGRLAYTTSARIEGRAGATYASGVWTPSSVQTHQFSSSSPEAELQAKLRVAMGPRLTVALYDKRLLSLYMESDVVATGSVEPLNERWWTVGAGLDVVVGAQAASASKSANTFGPMHPVVFDTVLAVGRRRVTSLGLSPASVLLAVGSTGQLAAVPTSDKPQPAIRLDRTVVWTSRDPSVAAVSPTGQLAAKKNGSAWVVAGVLAYKDTLPDEWVTDSVQVRIGGARVELRWSSGPVDTATGVTVDVGKSTTVQALFYDAAGTYLPGTTFTWTCSDPSIATVTQDGLVRGLAAGITVVRATANDGSTAAATVTVVDARGGLYAVGSQTSSTPSGTLYGVAQGTGAVTQIFSPPGDWYTQSMPAPIIDEAGNRAIFTVLLTSDVSPAPTHLMFVDLSTGAVTQGPSIGSWYGGRVTLLSNASRTSFYAVGSQTSSTPSGTLYGVAQGTGAVTQIFSPPGDWYTQSMPAPIIDEAGNRAIFTVLLTSDVSPAPTHLMFVDLSTGAVTQGPSIGSWYGGRVTLLSNASRTSFYAVGSQTSSTPSGTLYGVAQGTGAVTQIFSPPGDWYTQSMPAPIIDEAGNRAIFTVLLTSDVSPAPTHLMFVDLSTGAVTQGPSIGSWYGGRVTLLSEGQP